MLKEQENIIQKLKLAITGKLPGKISHVKMLPPGRQLEILPEDKSFLKKSSVLIILYPDKTAINCILIKRPANMKNHAGQIAFPGGEIDKSDKNAFEAALREANEEVGIDPGSIEIIGQLSEFYVHISSFLIFPYIGWCNKTPDLSPNRNEVDKIIDFPLSNYISDNKASCCNIQTVTGNLNVPCYKYKGEIIWGATAMILTELLDLLRLNSFKEELH
ncbi:MAG: CoA pyrophosphatase [Prolixibacteraceae bacterium]|nr:CoA pyrophosphatase [Prolixibacteraceae bacterium]MBN2773836.1 CoA pyrophosphatase [Prolixibacteraceae bacterium]